MEQNNNPQPQVRFVFPDPKVFSQNSGLGQVVRPEQVVITDSAVFAFERADYDEYGYIVRHFWGCLYPEKGFPFPQAIHACNMSKRYLLGFIRLFGKNKFVLAGGMLKKGFLSDLIKTYNDAADLNLAPFYYNSEYPRYYSPACKELKNFLDAFLKEIGVRQTEADRFTKIFITLIDNDNAYRYRIQDLAGVTSKERLLESFPAELDEVFAHYVSRENPQSPEGNIYMVDKLRSIVKIARFAWYISKFRKAIKAGIESVNWKNLCMDEADIYFTDLWLDYNFRGEPFEIRRKKFIARHDPDKLPPMIKYNPKQ
jgi:hypothetical protein